MCQRGGGSGDQACASRLRLEGRILTSSAEIAAETDPKKKALGAWARTRSSTARVNELVRLYLHYRFRARRRLTLLLRVPSARRTTAGERLRLTTAEYREGGARAGKRFAFEGTAYEGSRASSSVVEETRPALRLPASAEQVEGEPQSGAPPAATDPRGPSIPSASASRAAWRTARRGGRLEPERDGDHADQDQRPEVRPELARRLRRRGSRAGSRAARTSPARSTESHCIHDGRTLTG